MRTRAVRMVLEHGGEYGGGCEITEAVHIAIASDRAVFSEPEIKLSMPPTFGGTQGSRVSRAAILNCC